MDRPSNRTILRSPCWTSAAAARQAVREVTGSSLAIALIQRDLTAHIVAQRLGVAAAST